MPVITRPTTGELAWKEIGARVGYACTMEGGGRTKSPSGCAVQESCPAKARQDLLLAFDRVYSLPRG